MALRFRPAFALILGVCIVSGETLAGSRAKYAGEFLAIGVGGRALGLGSAYVALANDVTAGYWNPAGLAHLQYPQVTFMHDERFSGLVNYDYAAAAMPLGAMSSLAFSVIRLGVDNQANTRDAWTDANGNGVIESNELDYSRISYFNTADWALYFSYARKVDDNISYGANIKLIRRDLADASATGLGFDVGAQYAFNDRFAVGVNIQDVTTTFLAWSTGTNEFITPTLKLGSAYFIDAFEGRFAPAIDVDLRFENRQSASNAHLGPVSFDFHGGMEFNYRNILAVRAGLSDLGQLTAGTGIHLPKFDIDYSFAKFDGESQIGNTHRISLTFTLQADQFVRKTTTAE